jgi:hypothetical protein
VRLLARSLPPKATTYESFSNVVAETPKPQQKQISGHLIATATPVVMFSGEEPSGYQED